MAKLRVEVIRLTRTSFRMRVEGTSSWINFRWNSTLNSMYPEQTGVGTFIVGGETFEDAVRSGGRALRMMMVS